MGRGALNTWTNQQTPGVLLGYHYGSTSLYTSCLDQKKKKKKKQDTLGDLIRLPLPHRFTAALSHYMLFVSVKELVQMDGGGFFGQEFPGTLTLVSSAGRFL